MAEPQTQTLGKLAGSLTSLVVPKAKRLWAERSAGKGLLSPRQTLLDKGFSATLARLISGDDESWWRQLWDEVGHAIVTPELVAPGEVQVWLQDPDVQEDIKHLARSALLETQEDPEARSRLDDLHSKITATPEGSSRDLIQVVVTILLAGYVADMSPADERIAGLVVETSKVTRSDVGKVGEQLSAQMTQVAKEIEGLGPDQYVVDAHSQRALKQLRQIKRQRGILPDESRDEIKHLATSVLEGDLRHASHQIRSEVLTWAARIHASSSVDEALNLREKLIQLDPQADTRIIDALILQAEGDGEAAVRMLRDLEDPDARSTFFAVLRNLRGLTAAIDWLDADERTREPNFFTGIGCFNLALALAEADRWEEAADYLAQAHDQHVDWPDLAFLEGMVNAGLLLPFEQRSLEVSRLRLETRPLEGPHADVRRQRAIDSFQRAIQLPLPRGRKLAAEDAIRWLRLTHPDPKVWESERQSIKSSLEDPSKGTYLLPVAREFGIKFDLDSLWDHLNRRKRTGGLNDSEESARLMVAQMKLDPGDFLSFLESEESKLTQALPADLITFYKIDALLRNGQFSCAKALLQDNRDCLDDQDSRRIAASIAERVGQDPRQQFEDLYAETGDLLDLKNLVVYLSRSSDWRSLRPRLAELFDKERNLFNALQYVACMHRDSDATQDQILAFLENNQDLVDREPDLQAAKAKALFYAGKIHESRTLNKSLLESRDTIDDLHLDINLALQSGDWERFPSIVEREWPRKEEREPDILLRLAALAANADSSSNRAFELLKLAAAKAVDDPQILINALSLAFKLGHEDKETSQWLNRAVALSSEDGPARTFDVQTLVQEVMPKSREHQCSTEEQWLRGEVPLNIIAHVFNAPLSRLLIGIPRNNSFEKDGRRRTLIPIVSGARQPVKIEHNWKVCLDLSSLLVLAQVGLLKKAIASLRQVLIAPETMVLLLTERSRVLFHQPSRVKAAEALREHIDSGQLKVVESLPDPRQDLVNEVGLHLAQILQLAQNSGGLVITPRPIHKARSFMGELAQLGGYEEFAVSTVRFEETLYDSGLLDTEAHENASRYLSLQDKGGPSPDYLTLDRPLFLDDIAVNYLDGARLLPILAKSDLDLRIHPSLRDEQIALISASREGESLAEAIGSLRIIIRDALEDGAVGFLRRHDPADNERRLFEFAPVLSQFFGSDDDRDAVCLDDRYLNKLPSFIDSRGQSVPIVCILDILRYLQEQNAISQKERWRALHKLRRCGFVLVPVECEELLFYLRSAKWSDSGSLVESGELQSIRQTLAQMRSLPLLQIPDDVPYLGRLQEVGIWVIRQLWSDGEIESARAISLSEWTWRHFIPSPLDWIPIETEADGCLPESFVHYLSFLLRPRVVVSEEREQLYLEWVEYSVLRLLISANAEGLNKLAALMAKQIEEWSQDFGK